MNPISKDINPTYSTTGRIEAQKSVDVIARVSGWLQERYFQEGDKVKITIKFRGRELNYTGLGKEVLKRFDYYCYLLFD